MLRRIISCHQHIDRSWRLKLSSCRAHPCAIKPWGGDSGSHWILKYLRVKVKCSEPKGFKKMLTVSLFTQTSEEMSEKLNGLLVPLNQERNFTMKLNNSVHQMPKYLDYRKKGMVTPVRNQVRDQLHAPQNDSIRLMRIGGCFPKSSLLLHMKEREMRLQKCWVLCFGV